MYIFDRMTRKTFVFVLLLMHEQLKQRQMYLVVASPVNVMPRLITNQVKM